MTRSLKKDFSERSKWYHNRANAAIMFYINVVHSSGRILKSIIIYEEELATLPEMDECVKLTDLKVNLSDKISFLWSIISSQSALETFWVTFNETNGMICGDHGFFK
jgi:hypothetical protein